MFRLITVEKDAANKIQMGRLADKEQTNLKKAKSMNEIAIKEERQKKCNSQTHELIDQSDRLTD